MEKKRILIVDDMDDNLYLLRALLEGNGFLVDSAGNGAEALDVAHKNPPDLIVSDILMPVMDGFSLCREWKRDPQLKSIPFVFYTATYTGEQDRKFAEGLGAERFIIKPCEPEEFMRLMEETIEATAHPTAEKQAPAIAGEKPTTPAETDDRVFLQNYNATLVRKLEAKMLQLEKANRELERDIEERTEMEARLRRTLAGAYGALGAAVELRDPYTAGHQRRVAQLSRAIAAELGWDAERIEHLESAALLHDVGKIVVPAEILTKPGRLNDTEMELIREHASAGADMVVMVDAEGGLAEVVRQHHERLDGSGYPGGIAGDAILPAARVLAVADVVEAMMSHRPYRPGLPREAAMDEIRSGAGVRYDADAVAACVCMIEEQGFTFED